MIHQPFFVPAVAFAVLSVPLILGLIPPNPVYGVRTARTLSSRSVWLRTNRAAGWAVLIASAIYLEVARIEPWFRNDPGNFRVFLVHFVAFVVPLAGALVVATRFSKKSD